MILLLKIRVTSKIMIFTKIEKKLPATSPLPVFSGIPVGEGWHLITCIVINYS